jgi:hypothetical protein
MQAFLGPRRRIDRRLDLGIEGSLSSEEKSCYSVGKFLSRQATPLYLPIALLLPVV